MHADLLVMGGYSHSRMREHVLGGAITHVLTHAQLPVLMQHECLSKARTARLIAAPPN